MEITKRFVKFLEELQDPLVQEKYLTNELEEQLCNITLLINKVTFNDFKKMPSINDIQLLEEILAEGCLQISDKLKTTLDAIGLLHIYATNFVLTPTNVHKFLKTYCQAIFECTSISLLGLHSEGADFLQTIDGQKIASDDGYNKLMSQLNSLMEGKIIYALDTYPLGALEPYLAPKDYIGNIIFKLGENQTQFYLIMHFTKDSPFTGSFIAGGYYQDFSLTFKLLEDTVNLVLKNTFSQNKQHFLETLESLKLELIEIHKRYFLSFIATELHSSLECDVATSIILGQHEESAEKKLKEKNKKAVQIILADSSSIKLKNNFSWENNKLNQKLSVLWVKLQKFSNFREQRAFYHFYIQKTEDLFMEFSKNGKLVYQSKPIIDADFKNLVDVQDFLEDPKLRMVESLFGKSSKMIELIQTFIKETEESKAQLLIKEGKVSGTRFEFIGKRKEGKKIVGSFSIIFKEIKLAIPRLSSCESLDTLIIDLDHYNESFPKFKNTLTKMKRLLSARNLNTKNVLGVNADISALKKTIVSEYLPEELTNSLEDLSKPHKSIASVRRIKLETTIKTAFVDSPLIKKGNSGRSLQQIATFSSPKLNSFSVDSLKNRKTDFIVFEDWSFDAVGIDDVDEKHRLVWAMLNDFGLIKEFHINPHVLCEFIDRVKEKYQKNNNAYHDYNHGITVMHCTFYLLRHVSTKFTSLVNLGILISAFTHDVDHTGRTNMFEVNSLSRLALKYHDKSVLEQHHAAVTFKILSKETSNIFSNIKGDDYKLLRRLIISNIMATDMKVHFEIMNTFNDLRERMEASGEEEFTWSDDDVMIVTNMIVHCSDLCGPTKTFNVAYKWAQRINEEFTLQMREEDALEIPITPYFRDLEKPHVMAKQEIAFISYMIKPLWEGFCKFYSGSMNFVSANIENNIKEWNVLLEGALKKKEEEELNGKDQLAISDK